jgi:DNA modification methylase
MSYELHAGDARATLATLPAESIHCAVTSPPYWGLRDYGGDPVRWADGTDSVLGLEPTPEAYTAHLVEVCEAVRRVLRSDGVFWLNLGDSYGPDKSLVGIPWRLAEALKAAGWYLRMDVIWAKPNPMPESVAGWRYEQKDGRLVLRRGSGRPTKAHEYLFLLAKSDRYFYDADAIREVGQTYDPAKVDTWEKRKARGHKNNTEDHTQRGLTWGTFGCPAGGRNKRSVWWVATQPYRGAHFATFPEKLIEPCILAGTSARGCCPLCAGPWVRVVSRDRQRTRPGINNLLPDCAANRDPGRHVTTTNTLGWRPSCDCAAHPSGWLEPEPCVVLDPFVGSGTTCLVAERNGRNSVGIDANPEYLALAEVRINAANQSRNL